ncbi:MAG TPA: recombinase family protein, partial [Nitrospira sp.]|nr:recombinase family protein [Nitrospira sp.]
MIKRAVIYARVSTTKQAEKDLSIPDQLRAGNDYCRNREWTVVAEYVDPGVSATDDNRPEFQRMIDDAVRGVPGFQIIIVHSSSRFMRDAFLAEFYLRKLRKAGVDVIAITQDFGRGPEADMIRQMINLFDEYSSKETGKHVIRTMKENARLGFVNGLPPFGYKAVVAETRGEKVKKRLEKESDEAEIVQVMFHLARYGLTGNDPIGVKKISQELDSRGLRTRSGRAFSHAEVHAILTSTTYIGRYVFNKTSQKGRVKNPPDEWIIVPVPPIVDEETFDAVHAELRARDPMRSKIRFSSGRVMLLSKLARCGSCKGAMTLGTGKSGRYRYYVCSRFGRMSDGGCSDPQRIREDLLDDLVIEHMADVLFEPDRLRVVLEDAIQAEREAQAKAPLQLDALVRRKADLDRQIARSHKSIAVGQVEFDDKDFTEMLKGLKADRVETEKTLAALQSTVSQFPPLTASRMRAFSAALCSALRNGDDTTRRAYLRFFLARVIVRPREVEL